MQYADQHITVQAGRRCGSLTVTIGT